MRTINVGPKQLTCIATSAESIIAACEDIVNIYDAATFVLRQSLYIFIPEAATKIKSSPDGSILYLSHSSSITIWDVQTGGQIHIFTTRPKISDFAVSPTGDHIACGLSSGLVTSWDIHTKEGKDFGNGQPVVTIIWLSSQEVVVATQSSVYIYNIGVGRISSTLPISGHVWGMVQLASEGSSGGVVDEAVGGAVRDEGEDIYEDADDGVHEGEFLVGIMQSSVGVGQDLYTFEIIKCDQGHLWIHQQLYSPSRLESFHSPGQLLHPILVDKEVACITLPSGVQSFNTTSHNWTNNPLLLGAAKSVAVSQNKNLIVQTKDSIQIFSTDILMSGKSQNDVHPSHIYPLGEKHIACILHPNRHLTLLKLETLRELHPDNNTSPLGPLLTNQFPSACASVSRGLVAEFGISAIIQAWRSGTPLPEWTEAADEDEPLGGTSPGRTRIVTVYGSPRQELHVKDAKDGAILAKLPLGHNDLGMGKVYDLAFDSETRFHLKIDRVEQRVQIPYDITASPSGQHLYTITRGEPVALSESRETPPYTLDANCEWVLDAESRKVCWIPPENIRRGNGGHFWAGLLLVMVGVDGVVRKLAFKGPDY